MNFSKPQNIFLRFTFLSFLIIGFYGCHAHKKIVKPHKKKVEHFVDDEPKDTVAFVSKYKKEILSHADSFQLLKSYKVALVLPFQLDSFFHNKAAIESSNIPKAVFPALDFYEGCLIAIDSLKKTKLNLELNVVDYSSSFQSFSPIATQKKLSEMNLLIGTLNSSDAKHVASYSYRKKINFVSPVANNFMPEFNPYYLALNPNAVIQQTKLLDLVEEKYGSKINVIVIHQANSIEENIAASSISSILQKFSGIHPVEIILNNKNFSDSAIAEFDSTKRNIVFVASNEFSFVNTVSKNVIQLANRYPITILGMPSWVNHEAMKNIFNKNVEVLITNSYLLNRSNAEYIKFHRNFTERFHVRPSELAIRGYETMLLCGLMLNKYGTKFNYFMNEPFSTVYGKIMLQKVLTHERKQTFTQYYNNQLLNIMKLSSLGFQNLKAE